MCLATQKVTPFPTARGQGRLLEQLQLQNKHLHVQKEFAALFQEPLSNPPSPSLPTFQQEGAPHLPERLPPDRRYGTCTGGGQAHACGGPLAPE